ncbi:MAG: amino acid oxidase, partial [Thermodesulfobacteriota bacterium]
TRASYANQARVHGGYHYPRSFMTAWRSLINLPRFYLDFRDSIEDRFTKVYAVARNLSQVNAFQFKKFCQQIGAPLKPAAPAIRRLFNEDMIEAVFYAKEYAFNALKLRSILKQRLERCRVMTLLKTRVTGISPLEGDLLKIELSDGASLTAGQTFNCTYSNINTLLHHSHLDLLPLKHELTELALIQVPEELKNLGITVMDGPFFSLMPFPPRNLHSLSHVRYTPHQSWLDTGEFKEAENELKSQPIRSNFPLMWKDAQRYLPVLAGAKYEESLFEIKTVLQTNEIDDGRPILFRTHPAMKNLTTIMGGKIDNIYDVLQALQRLELFSRKQTFSGDRGRQVL